VIGVGGRWRMDAVMGIGRAGLQAKCVASAMGSFCGGRSPMVPALTKPHAQFVSSWNFAAGAEV